MSKPCVHCTAFIKKLGIKKVLYSDDDGQIIREKTRDLQTNHESMARKMSKMK